MKFYFTALLLLWGIPLISQTVSLPEIEALVQQALPKKSGPGLTLAVVKEGKIVHQLQSGYMNLVYDLPFNDSTRFALASVTKQFTSACVGVLAKQGKISVEDDVRRYIPELPFYEDTIRIKHLLNHTSGIRNHNVLLDLAGFDFQHRGYTNAMIEEMMFRQKGVNNRPGEKMLYSNTNYVLLALLIERVSGKKLADFAQETLFTPLGMTATSYKKDVLGIVKNRAQHYMRAGNTYRQNKSLNLCIGAGGMYSTLADLAQWMQVFLNPKHEYAYLADFVTQLDTLEQGELMKHARGMFVSPYKGYTSYNHSGRDRGMRSQWICLPELNVGVIAFSNANEIDVVDLSYQVLDLWIKSPKKASKNQARQAPFKPLLPNFTGHYQELNSDMRMKLLIENDTLKALSSFGRYPVPLTAISERSFTRVNNPSVTYTFQDPKIEDIHMMVDFGGAIFYFERVRLSENPDQNLEEYAGMYYSKELDVHYELQTSPQGLLLNYPNQRGLVLKEGEEDVFGANRRTKYAFIRNQASKVVAMAVSSEGTVQDILFEKIK